GFLTPISQLKQLVTAKPKWPSNQHRRKGLTAGVVLRGCTVVDATGSLEPLFYLIDRTLHDFDIVVAPHRWVILTRNQRTKTGRRGLRQNLLFGIPHGTIQLSFFLHVELFNSASSPQGRSPQNDIDFFLDDARYRISLSFDLVKPHLQCHINTLYGFLRRVPGFNQAVIDGYAPTHEKYKHQGDR